MSPKSIAFLIVGMLVISSVFFMFHVTYPDSPATIKLNPQQIPKNVTPPNMKIFNNQSLNLPRLGLNQTSFTPSGNVSLILSGYVYNNSNPSQVLANQKLGIAVMQAFTTVTTNSQGFYQVKILASGQGTFAFKMFQYATKLYQMYISPGATSMTKDIYLSPMQKYSVSGLTQSHGNDISGVGLTFNSFWGSYNTYSGSNGAYSVSMVSDTYTILAQKTGFSSIPDPVSVNLGNASISQYNLQLNSSNQAILYMSGYIFNELSQPISGATVSIVSPSLPNSAATTYANGFYNISVAYYTNVVQVSAIGYTTLSQTLDITHNTTNENFTLTSFNPFEPGPNTGLQVPGPLGMNNNSAQVNYAQQNFLSIQGTVYNNQTAMAVIDQAFSVYTSVNGSYYYYDMQSSSSGQYFINMSYGGNYNFTILSQKFNPTWLNENLSQSLNNVFIWVTTSQSNIFNINGSLLNKITNLSLQNATINITGPGGVLLKSIKVSPNGSYNFSLIGGNYQLNISAPGFNSTTYNLNANQNYSNLNFSLSPTTGISPGSSQWAPSNGTGLPGVNSTNLLNQFNSTQNTTGQSPTTTSGTPVNLTLQFNVNATATPIPLTEYVLFIKVNGLYLQVKGVTNSSGGSILSLAYGGTYIIIPEMVDYSGNAQFVNTSNVSPPLEFNMTKLPSYSLQLNLSNPYNYTSSSVPYSGLNAGSGYALKIVPQSEHEYSNYTLVNFSLPNGTYSFSYNNPAYVPVPTFYVNISGSSVTDNKVLTPYILNLSWNSPVTWGYTVTKQGATVYSDNPITAGSYSETLGMTTGTFNFQSYIGSVSANSTLFTISNTASEYSINLVITGYTVNITQYAKSSNITLSGNGYNALFNYSVPYLGSDIFVKQFLLDISNGDTITVLMNSAIQSGTITSGAYTLSKYFATQSTTPTAISIKADGLTSQQLISVLNNVTMVYYKVSIG